jgi:hypothetical protein
MIINRLCHIFLFALGIDVNPQGADAIHLGNLKNQYSQHLTSSFHQIHVHLPGHEGHSY